MNRREFFGKIIGGLAATAAVRQWPFRVYSFPTELIMPQRDLVVYGSARGGGKSLVIRGLLDPHSFRMLLAQRRLLLSNGLAINYDIRAVEFDHEAYVRRTAAKLEKITAV